ncbi:ATP-binding cassette domain-containing protein [Porphyromonadaceae bacterium]
MEQLIRYRNVNVTRKEHVVLTDVNFDLYENEFLYIIGRVGTGKSSLVKTIYGEVPIEEGEAKVLEYNLSSIKEKDVPFLRRKIGIVFQDFQLLIDRSVHANLEFVLKATGWTAKHEINDRIDEVLRLVGMETKGYKMPHELSGGEQQRIVIARALLNNPQIILADEPTGNLDPETGNQIVQLLQKISKNGTSIVMITHNLRVIQQFPGRVLECRNGSLESCTTERMEYLLTSN